MEISEFQRRIEAIFGDKDRRRGSDGTFRWFVEEVGELARAIRKGEKANLEEEFADCLAWLATLASIHGVDLDAAAQAKYPGRCVKCDSVPCACRE